jgi:hypothetical protein
MIACCILSVCCYNYMYALVHIECRVAFEMPKDNVHRTILKVIYVSHKIIIIFEI